MICLAWQGVIAESINNPVEAWSIQTSPLQVECCQLSTPPCQCLFLKKLFGICSNQKPSRVSPFKNVNPGDLLRVHVSFLAIASWQASNFLRSICEAQPELKRSVRERSKQKKATGFFGWLVILVEEILPNYIGNSKASRHEPKRISCDETVFCHSSCVEQVRRDNEKNSDERFLWSMSELKWSQLGSQYENNACFGYCFMTSMALWHYGLFVWEWERIRQIHQV